MSDNQPLQINIDAIPQASQEELRRFMAEQPQRIEWLAAHDPYTGIATTSAATITTSSTDGQPVTTYEYRLLQAEAEQQQAEASRIWTEESLIVEDEVEEEQDEDDREEDSNTEYSEDEADEEGDEPPRGDVAHTRPRYQHIDMSGETFVPNSDIGIGRLKFTPYTEKDDDIVYMVNGEICDKSMYEYKMSTNWLNFALLIEHRMKMHGYVNLNEVMGDNNQEVLNFDAAYSPTKYIVRDLATNTTKEVTIGIIGSMLDKEISSAARHIITREPIYSSNIIYTNPEYLTKFEYTDLSVINKEEFLSKAANGRMPLEQIEMFSSVIDSVQNIYPNMWEMKLDTAVRTEKVDNEYGYVYDYLWLYRIAGAKIIRTRLIMYFPEIVITNQENAFHTIKDIFVCLKWDNGKLSPNLSTARTSYTPEEIDSSYVHSHAVWTMWNMDFKETCCLGDGNVAQTLMLLGTEYDEDMFRLLLYNIRGYLEYESIETTPYALIKNIKHKQEDIENLSMSDVRQVLSNIIIYCPQDKLKAIFSNINLNRTNDTISVIKDAVFETQLVELLTNSSYEARTGSYVFASKDYTGKYYKVSLRRNNHESGRPKTPYIFRREPIEFKLLPSRLPKTHFDAIFPHPQITTYVKERFEYAINQSLIQNSRARRLTYSKNTKQNPG